MRLAVLYTTCFLALVPSAASAQLLSLGVRGGASLSTMSLTGSGAPAGRTSMAIGPTAVMWLSDHLAFQFDALYVGKGFTADESAGVTTLLSLSYLEVPLVAVYALPKAGSGMFQARLQGGTAFGFRVRCSVDAGTGDVTGITDCDPENVATFDLGLVGGAGLKIGKGRGGLTIDATYTFGLLDANLNPALTARNRALLISAGFLFPIM